MTAATKNDFTGAFRWALLFYALFELVSFFGFLLPQFSSAAFLVVVAVVGIIAIVRPDLALVALLAELFVGSQGGYMLAFGLESGLALSLRIGLFLAVFGVWFAKALAGALAGGERRRESFAWLGQMAKARLLVPYAVLMVVIAFGAVRGILLGNDLGNVFFDANGYAYFALFPAFIAAFADRSLPARVSGLLTAAVAVSVAKALGVLFFFSHRLFHFAQYIYVWIRDTRVGEITIMTADFYRVFFQSQIFVLATIFAAALLFAYAPSLKARLPRAAAAFMAWAMVSMVLSLSRSFWFGGFAAALALFALLIWGRADRKVWGRLVGLGVGSIVAAVLIVGVVYSFPWPRKTGDLSSFAGLLGGRAFSVSGEAAANSRWALLPKLNEAGAKRPLFGSGLGTTVTYTTSDPRLLADIPTGEYTTFAFEWGYHDLWVKFGLVGVGIYAWFLWALLAPLVAVVRSCRDCFRTANADAKKEPPLLAAGLVLGLAAMLATNVFSPYLNHPLGIGLLMLAGSLVAVRAFDPSRNA